MAAASNISPRQFALDVVERLRTSGFEAYWAGGCVRDQLLGLLPKDYDVATSATPDETRRVFGHRHTLAIGAAFGVIAVVGPRSAGLVEVTTFRQDTSYSDGRRPDQVQYSTAELDAQRRDFTINGLFYDPIEHRVVDYVDGERDLHAGIVRAIGNPLERFTEDKLRLLRGVRMSARFGFAIEPHTFAALRQMAAEITVVSPERIAQEMRQLLVLPRRELGARLLHESGLLVAILPQLYESVGNQPAAGWAHALRVLDVLESPTFALSLAVLLGASPAAGPRLADQVARQWRLSGAERDRTAWLLTHRQALIAAAQQRRSELQPLLIHPGIEELLAWHEAEARLGATDHLDDVDYCRAQLQLAPEQLNPPPLASGHDLARLGIPTGPLYARLLARLRAAQLDGEVDSHQAALELLDRWSKET